MIKNTEMRLKLCNLFNLFTYKYYKKVISKDNLFIFRFVSDRDYEASVSMSLISWAISL